MVQGLSKREKVLLFAAGLLVVLYLSIQFAILPLMTRHMNAVQERNNLRTEQARVDDDIRNSAAIESAHSDAVKKFDDIKKEYPLLVPNEEVVTILTNLCITNGLSPTRLNITSPPYPTAPAASGSEGDTADATTATPESLFTIITATVNATGSYESLTKLLDEVDTKQYIRITTMSYSVNRQRDPTEPTTTSVTFNLELTYVNP